MDFRLFFLGEISRADISGRFDVAPAVTTRDLARYRVLPPDNIRIDGSSKTYQATDKFSPLFEHSLDRALSLSKGFGDGLGGAASGLVPCGESPAPISRPTLEVLVAITRVISEGLVLSISYVSSTSGLTEREIVPLVLADSGLRWHVRAFDRKTSSFRDFVLTRICAFQVASSKPLLEESAAYDGKWSREIELEVIPHPNFPRSELATLDYSMKDGALLIRARAALAGYILSRWNIDCSEGHVLRSPEYRLWLRNRTALESVDSASFAPGYLYMEVSHG